MAADVLLLSRRLATVALVVARAARPRRRRPAVLGVVRARRGVRLHRRPAVGASSSWSASSRRRRPPTRATCGRAADRRRDAARPRATARGRAAPARCIDASVLAAAVLASASRVARRAAARRAASTPRSCWRSRYSGARRARARARAAALPGPRAACRSRSCSSPAARWPASSATALHLARGRERRLPLRPSRGPAVDRPTTCCAPPPPSSPCGPAAAQLRGRRRPLTPGLGVLLAGIAGAGSRYWLLATGETWVGVVLACAVGAMAAPAAAHGPREPRDRRRARAPRSPIASASPSPTRSPGCSTARAVEQALRAQRGPSPGVIVLELDDRGARLRAARRRRRRGRRPPPRRRRRRHRRRRASGAAELVLLVPRPRRHARRPPSACASRSPASRSRPARSAPASASPGRPTTATGEELLRAAQQARELARELGGNQVRADGEPVGARAAGGRGRRGRPPPRLRGPRPRRRPLGRRGGRAARARRRDPPALRAGRPAARRRPRLRARRRPAPPALTPGLDDLVRLEDHPLARRGAEPGAPSALLGDAAPAVVRHHEAGRGEPAAGGPDRRGLQRVGEPARGSRRPRPARASRLPARSCSRAPARLRPDVVRAFLNLELSGAVGGHEATDLSPERPHAAADEILAATASAAAAPSPPLTAGPARPRARRHPRWSSPPLSRARRLDRVGRHAAHGGGPPGRAPRRARRGRPRSARARAPARRTQPALTPAARRYREQLSAVVDRSAESAELRARRALAAERRAAGRARGRPRRPRAPPRCWTCTSEPSS